MQQWVMVILKNNGLTKKFGGKAEKWYTMENKDFERLQHIPDHLEGLTHKQDGAHPQETPSKALHSQFWLTLTLHKQEMNTKAEL